MNSWINFYKKYYGKKANIELIENTVKNMMDFMEENDYPDSINDYNKDDLIDILNKFYLKYPEEKNKFIKYKSINNLKNVLDLMFILEKSLLNKKYCKDYISKECNIDVYEIYEDLYYNSAELLENHRETINDAINYIPFVVNARLNDIVIKMIKTCRKSGHSGIKSFVIDVFNYYFNNILKPLTEFCKIKYNKTIEETKNIIKTTKKKINNPIKGEIIHEFSC